MSVPRVSVVVPAYNAATFLKRSVASALSQTVDDIEVIIVDDGSTDDTPRVINELERTDPRIRSFRIEHSGGAARPKNYAISKASAPFIATLDADDEWYPEKLEEQLVLFENSGKQNLGFVTCFSKYIFEREGVTFSYAVPVYDSPLPHILARDFMGSGSGMMYRKEVFDTVGGFDESLESGQDAEMRIRLLQHYSYDVVKKVLFSYYFHGKNLTEQKGIEKRMKDVEYIMHKWERLYDQYPESLSDRIRYNATSHMLAGDSRGARRLFMRSIRVNFLNYKSYCYLLLSFLGQRVYKKLTFIKASIV